MLASTHALLTPLALLLIAGTAAQWLASITKLPSLLLLLLAGLALGPLSGIVEPREVLGELFRPAISLAVAVVLFEGGLTLRLSELPHVGRAVHRLILVGLTIGPVITFAITHFVAGLDVGTSTAFAAITVVTGPTVILPMLRSARIAKRPATLLKWEGIVNDPLGVLLVVLAVQLACLPQQRDSSAELLAVLGSFAWRACLAGIIGYGAGRALGWALAKDKIPEGLRTSVILGAVLGVFTIGEQLHQEAGLLAVTIIGIVLSNHRAPIEDIHRFKEQVSNLLVGFLFITLAADLDKSSFGELFGAPALAVFGLIFVARPVMVAVATINTRLNFKERLLVAWIAPRGVVAAAMAGALQPELVKANWPDAKLLTPAVFGVIVATVILHGLSVRPLARRLGLAAMEGKGILLVGASRWSTDLGLALTKAGCDVIVSDNRYRRVSQARQQGLETHYGNLLHEEVDLELPMERISWVFAASDLDSNNSLVSLHYRSQLGREHTLQLASSDQESSGEGGAGVEGRSPWGSQVTYDAITRRWWQGARFKVTKLSAEYTLDKLRLDNSEGLVLFAVHDERLRPVASDTQELPTGAKVVSLV